MSEPVDTQAIRDLAHDLDDREYNPKSLYGYESGFIAEVCGAAADEIDALRKDNARLREVLMLDDDEAEMLSDAVHRRREAQRERDAARAALTFYANRTNWVGDDANGIDSLALCDNGRRARIALREETT